jgi:phosphopantetheinyl transferase
MSAGVTWHEALSDHVAVPAVLVTPAAAPAARHALMRAMVAGALGIGPEAVRLDHDATGRPFIAEPADCGLHVSLAGRDGLAAIALAREPVGVDLEIVDPAGAIPLNVLHRQEQARLETIADAPTRAETFCAIWTVKEAYLKALGTGLNREPSTFAVLPGAPPRIDDPERSSPYQVETRRFAMAGQIALVSIVRLDGGL